MTAEHQEKRSFQAEVKQLLDIVVHSLYSNKEIFLRELISNASDAIDKLKFQALSDKGLYENDSDLAIRICYDKDAHLLTISDNGIGMTRDEVVENLGTIAKSGTREFLSHLTGDQKKDAHLIGQFGVGFYSAFMVADQVTVETRRAGMEQEHGARWTSKGDGEYTIETITRASRGTTITLHLKEEAAEEYLNDWRLQSIIKKYSDHINVPIMMPERTEEDKPKDTWTTVNKAEALWTLPKNSIKPEQFNEFYKHISHDFEDPLAHTMRKIEGGNIEYTTILYLPSHAPFDLWQRDTHFGLKLYVQRVFIMDQVEQFLPHYLRFVRGVIDTTALPLNISREILQDHPTISKLKSALVRHVLDLLEQIAKDDPEKYQKFWGEFGSVLKEGPAEDFVNRERIANLFRFATNQKSEGQTVSLKDYVSRMGSTQKKIYYLTAENVSAAKSSPHLEIFNKKNIEVLLLTDRIDEWVVAHLPEFEGKALQSIAKGDLELSDIENETKAEKESEAKENAAQENTYAPLIKDVQEHLGSRVKEVRLSHRLISSPACLVRDKDAIGPQMERLLKAAGQQVTEAVPILELNPTHPIIKKLSALPKAKLQEWSVLLYEEALLAEGSPLKDPADFVKRLNHLWVELSDKSQ